MGGFFKISNMKKFKVIGASVTTHKGLTFRTGDVISENKLDAKAIPALVKDGVITEEKPSSKTTSDKKDETV